MSFITLFVLIISFCIIISNDLPNKILVISSFADKMFNRYGLCNSSKHFLTTIVAQEKLADEGNEVARKYAEAYKTYASILDILQNPIKLQNSLALQSRIIIDIASILRTDRRVPAWSPNHLNIVMNICDVAFKRQNLETPWVPSELDKSIRMCQVDFKGLNPKNYLSNLDLAIDSIEKYPSEPFLYFMQGTMLGFLRRMDEGVQVSTLALEKFPTHLGLLYNKASFLKHASKPTIDERIEAWQTFLRHSSKSDRHVPEFYYEIGVLTALEYIPQAETSRAFIRGLNTMKYAFKCGEEAEESILPCNVHDRTYFHDLKLVVKDAIKRGDRNKSQIDSECERTRNIIVDHRNLLYMDESSKNEKICEQFSKLTVSETTLQTSALQLGKFIKYTSIEPAVIIDSDSVTNLTLNLVLQRGHFGRIVNCQILNFNIGLYDKSGKDIQHLFGTGCKISIAETGKNERFIQIDNPCSDLLILHPEEHFNRLCNYCGVQDASMECQECKLTFYCDAYCQKKDLEAYGHEQFCIKMLK